MHYIFLACSYFLEVKLRGYLFNKCLVALQINNVKQFSCNFLFYFTFIIWSCTEFEGIMANIMDLLE